MARPPWPVHVARECILWLVLDVASDLSGRNALDRRSTVCHKIQGSPRTLLVKKMGMKRMGVSKERQQGTNRQGPTGEEKLEGNSF